MRCCNCGGDSWRNVDKHRIAPKGMSLCTICGFCSYPALWKSDEEIKQYYRSNYRQPPNAANLFTGQRKCHFHHAFLKDVFVEWTTKQLKEPAIFEVGAAYGLALNWIRQVYKGAHVAGSELTTSYRRNAYHEFGIKLEEDFDKTKKHDLIMSYKVAEHQTDVDLRLREYADCLSDGGYLYISVPTWFDQACNFGMPGFDLEYYYSPDHINSWTRPIFKNILQRAGFEIVKENFVMYDSTYLCKVNLANRELPIFKEDPVEIESRMEKIKKAYFALSENDCDTAIALWPDYPQAWSHYIEKNRKAMFEKGWEFINKEFIPSMLAACNNARDVWMMCTDLAMRAKQWDAALKYCEESLRANPENPIGLMALQNIMREKALAAPTEKEKTHYFVQARNVARHGRSVGNQNLKDFTDSLYLYNAQIAIPDETVP